MACLDRHLARLYDERLQRSQEIAYLHQTFLHLDHGGLRLWIIFHRENGSAWCYPGPLGLDLDRQRLGNLDPNLSQKKRNPVFN
jgi:hypothetical protein